MIHAMSKPVRDAFAPNPAMHHQIKYLKQLVKKNVVDRKKVKDDTDFVIQLNDNPNKNNHQEIADNAWNTLTPTEWVKENNLMSFLDLSDPEYLEDPDTGEIHELSKRQTQQNISHIIKERNKILATRKQQGILVSDLRSITYFNMWIPVCQINGLRAVSIVRKQNVIKGSLQNWILDKINETGQISPTKLVSLYFNEMELKSVKLAKNKLKKPLQNLIDNLSIELVEKTTLSFYKLNKCEFEEDKFRRVL